MPRALQKPKSKCPECGFNLGNLMNELQGKQFRRAEEGEKLSAVICPNCKTALIPL